MKLQAIHEASVVQQHDQQEQLEQQQAEMDDKLLGSYALKAYKGKRTAGLLFEPCVEECRMPQGSSRP